MISSQNLELRRWFSQEHLKDASEDVSLVEVISIKISLTIIN